MTRETYLEILRNIPLMATFIVILTISLTPLHLEVCLCKNNMRREWSSKKYSIYNIKIFSKAGLLLQDLSIVLIVQQVFRQFNKCSLKIVMLLKVINNYNLNKTFVLSIVLFLERVKWINNNNKDLLIQALTKILDFIKLEQLVQWREKNILTLIISRHINMITVINII